MNILVTGVAGFIGMHLAARLLSKGHAVTGTIRRAGMVSADSKRRLKKLEAYAASIKAKLQIVRCEEYEALYTSLQQVRPEVCVHLAGKSWVRESIGYPELYEEANYKFTIALLEALRHHGCRRLIFASSVMVYGKDAPLPFAEDHLGTCPLSPYGASKLACEVLINTYRQLHKLQTVNLRLFSVYGPDMRADCVPHIIATSILKKQPFTVYGDGSAMRDYVDVEDVVNAFETAIGDSTSYAALNIGSGFGTSVVELLQLIEQQMGKKAEVVHKPGVAGELALAIPDISLAMEKLKWEPRVNLETGIKRMTAWFKNPDTPLAK